MLPGDPTLPPGVNEARDICYDEPATCEMCQGDGWIDCTPCCGSPYVKTDDGWKCFRCVETFTDRQCPECRGKGVVSE